MFDTLEGSEFKKGELVCNNLYVRVTQSFKELAWSLNRFGFTEMLAFFFPWSRLFNSLSLREREGAHIIRVSCERSWTSFPVAYFTKKKGGLWAGANGKLELHYYLSSIRRRGGGFRSITIFLQLNRLGWSFGISLALQVWWDERKTPLWPRVWCSIHPAGIFFVSFSCVRLRVAPKEWKGLFR